MFGKTNDIAPAVGKVPERLMYNTAEIATLLGGVTTRYVEQLIAEGTLPSIKLGRRRMVEHAALIEFVDELRTAHVAAQAAAS